MHMLKLQDIGIDYIAKSAMCTAVTQFSMTLSRGELACLTGPSGSGKSSILRAIAGFEPLARGAIWINGQLVSSAGEIVPPEKRSVGMVFQDYALFPHLTVAENIAFGLRKLDRNTRTQRVSELLGLTGLQPLGDRYVHEISGGQQQRVAVARALAPRPSLLLLDEPFSSLDETTRFRLIADLRKLLKQSHCTALAVSHDPAEARAFGDRIIKMPDQQRAPQIQDPSPVLAACA